MDEYMARDSYRILPFMFVLHLFVLGSLYFIAMMGGALDFFLSQISGFEATCVTLPIAFGLTFLSLVVYPRLKAKAQTPTMLLLTFTMLLNGVLAFEVIALWCTFTRRYGF
jgi:hypothetical protein